MTSRLLLILLPLCLAQGRNTKDWVMAERNLEKRANRAIEFANHSLDVARKAYQKGDMEGTQSALQDLVSAVRLCDESLEASGKDGRRNPKWFKRVEIGLRQLLRRLETFEFEASFDDRPPIAEAAKVAQEVQQKVLRNIMTKEKR
jgi:hypothetical protein